MSGDAPTRDTEGRAVRLAVQEVITTQVVIRNRAERDRLLDAHLETYGEDVLDCILSFIYANAVEDVDVEIANDRFHYLLTRIGDLVDLIAEVTASDPVEILTVIAGHDWAYSENAAECESDDALRAAEAMRAAQVCLMSHHFVRRGSAPWGIQQTLDLEDMCAVVNSLGFVLCTLPSLVDEEHYPQFARILLADVEMILRAVARAKGLAVSTLVSEYFMQLILGDA